jgi:hypothetical protein
MRCRTSAMPKLALALLAATVVHGQRICSVPFPFPRLPIQANAYLPAVAAAQNISIPMKTQIIALPIAPPRDRFLVIDSVAVKGTHPSNTYLAIELRTTTTVSVAQVGQSVGPALPAQQLWVRHFLYTKSTQSENLALSLREPLNLNSAPGMTVYVGIQSSAASPLEQMDVAVTGYWVDACRWGQ